MYLTIARCVSCNYPVLLCPVINHLRFLWLSIRAFCNYPFACSTITHLRALQCMSINFPVVDLTSSHCVFCSCPFVFPLIANLCALRFSLCVFCNCPSCVPSLIVFESWNCPFVCPRINHLRVLKLTICVSCNCPFVGPVITHLRTCPAVAHLCVL